MNSIPKGLRFQVFALALGGLSIFIFVALLSPYTQTRARLKLLQSQIRAAIAAERFLRYSVLEVKEAIDYGLIEEGEDRKEELQNNADGLFSDSIIDAGFCSQLPNQFVHIAPPSTGYAPASCS